MSGAAMDRLTIFADRYEHPDQRLKAGRELALSTTPALSPTPDVLTLLVDVVLDKYKGLRMVGYRLLRRTIRQHRREKEKDRKRIEARDALLQLPIDVALLQTFASSSSPDVSTASAGGDGEKAEALQLIQRLLFASPSRSSKRQQTTTSKAPRTEKEKAAERDPEETLEEERRAGPSSAMHRKETTLTNILGLLVTLAEAADEPYHPVALELLCEAALVYPHEVAEMGGLRRLIEPLTERQHPLRSAIHDVTLLLMDRIDTRHLLRPSIDIESIFGSITDAYSKGTMTLDSVNSSLQAAVRLLKSWCGLFYFCAHKRRAIASFVDALRMPQPDIQKMGLSALRHLFQREERTTAQQQHEKKMQPLKCQLHDQYLAILLMILIDAGLLTALTEMIETGEQDVIDASTLMANEVLMLSNRLLPKWDGFHAQALPKLFDLAATFSDAKRRHNAIDAILHIDRPSLATTTAVTEQEEQDQFAAAAAAALIDDKLDGKENEEHAQQKAAAATPVIGVNSENLFGKGTVGRVVAYDFTENRRDRAQQQMRDLKSKMGTAMDEAHFRQLLNDTNVLLVKDFTRWQWALVMEVLEGPLLHPRRMEEVLRNTKFIKRLLFFFRPQTHHFSDLSAAAPNENDRFIRYGMQLMQTLMHTAEGAKYLAEMGFLSDLHNALQRVEPMQAVNDTDPIFSRDRMTKTLTKEYFTMIGILSANDRGIKLLESSEIFTLFYRLVELRSRDDIVRALITCMRYDSVGHPRIILSRCLTSANRAIRLYATRFLRQILALADTLASRSRETWIIDLLVAQLYDPSTEIADEACLILDEVCAASSEHLEYLIRCRPALDHLGMGGQLLQRRFLEMEAGFQFLWQEEGDTVAAQIATPCQHYATTARFFHPASLHPSSSRAASAAVDAAEDRAMVLARRWGERHLLGDIAKTKSGARQLIPIIDAITHRLEEQSRLVVTRHHDQTDHQQTLQEDCWAIGHIGASESGAECLLSQSGPRLISALTTFATQQQTLTLKGVALYALGLLARAKRMRPYLQDAGWLVVLPSDDRHPVVLPTTLDVLCDLEDWATGTDATDRDATDRDAMDRDATAGASARVTAVPDQNDWLGYIGNLGNNLVATAAMKELTKMKATAITTTTTTSAASTSATNVSSSGAASSAVFAKPFSFLQALDVAGRYRFRLAARRFIFALFDTVSLSCAAVDAFHQRSALLQKQEEQSRAAKARQEELMKRQELTQTPHQKQEPPFALQNGASAQPKSPIVQRKAAPEAEKKSPEGNGRVTLHPSDIRQGFLI